MDAVGSRVRLTDGEYRILEPEQIESWRASSDSRAVVNENNQPILNHQRERALRRLEQFVWWNMAERFPEQPNENLIGFQKTYIIIE